MVSFENTFLLSKRDSKGPNTKVENNEPGQAALEEHGSSNFFQCAKKRKRKKNLLCVSLVVRAHAQCQNTG